MAVTADPAAGFEAVYLSGSGVTNTMLDAPDIGLLTMTELTDQVAAVRDAVTLPIVVDADVGFGRPARDAPR